MKEIEDSDIEKNLGHAERILKEAESNLDRLEEVRTCNEELKRKEAQAIANLTNLQDAIVSLSDKIARKKGEIESFRQRLNALQTQADVERKELIQIHVPSDQPVDALKQYIAAFDNQISGLRAEQETAFKLMQQDKKRVEELAAKNLCPLCLQTLTEDYKNNLVQRIQAENDERQRIVIQLQRGIEELQQKRTIANAAFFSLQCNLPKINDWTMRIEEELATLSGMSEEFETKQQQEVQTREALEAVRMEISKFDISELEKARGRKNEAYNTYHLLDRDLQVRRSRLSDLARRMDEIKNRIDRAQRKLERVQKIAKISRLIADIREAYRSIQPKLRSEFIRVLRNFVQQVLDRLTGEEGLLLNVTIDDTYTPYVKSESGVEREVSYLSGGERTLLAFAYRLGLGQLMMQSRTGHGLSMLLLDEPTESLGREDGSIDRLAESISRFKAVEQIIAVTHSEAFAEKAEHVIRLEKEAGASKISIER
jgi:exonuclease SbcC